MKKIYFVGYGSQASEFEATSWKEAAVFIKHCLDEGTEIRYVQARPA